MVQIRWYLKHGVAVAALALGGLALGQGAGVIIPDRLPLLVLPQPVSPQQVYVEPPVTGHGFAGDKDIADAALEKLTAALRSDDYGNREAATRELLLLKPERLDDIRHAFERETDPEAAARLQTVAVHLYLKARTLLSGNATLVGVRRDSLSFELMRLDPQRNEVQLTVAILEVEAGFPAAQVLFPGDRVLAIDGERFQVASGAVDPDTTQFELDSICFEEFRSKVAKHRPGDLLKFTIMRAGKVQDVTVQTAGLAESGPLQEEAILQRNEAARRFVAGLRSSVKTLTLVMPGAKRSASDLIPAPNSNENTRF